MLNKFRKLVWTQHSEIKMKQYGLSKSKLSNILRRPERKEKGIVPGTTAVMRTNKVFGNKTISLFNKKQVGNPPKAQSAFGRARAPGEIWLMYKDLKMRDKSSPSAGSGQVRRIISAWRYPGITKPGDAIPIPDDIREELLNEE